MEACITLLETVQLCKYCGKKINKGSSAIEISGEGIFFCNDKCFIKNSEE